MNKNVKIGIGVIALLLIAGGVYGALMKNDDVMMSAQMKEASTEMVKDDMATDEMPMEDGVAAKKADDLMATDDTMKDDMMESDAQMADDTMMKKGVYEAYMPEKLMKAETGDVVLFFHASWCPSCRGLNADIEANMEAIPGALSILKVDYDKETELKKKYGVTTQYTLVQVDKDGNLIKKWSGSPSLAGLVSQIQ